MVLEDNGESAATLKFVSVYKEFIVVSFFIEILSGGLDFHKHVRFNTKMKTPRPSINRCESPSPDSVHNMFTGFVTILYRLCFSTSQLVGNCPIP